MPAGAVAGGGLLYNVYSSERASRRSASAQSEQQRAYEQDLALRRQFLEQQQGLYGPLEQQLVDQARSPLPLFYGPLSGQVQRSYDASGRNLATQFAQRGLSGSNLQGATLQGLELGRAGALSTAFQQGLQQRLALAQNVLSRYQPLANTQNVSQGLGQLGGFYGQQAQLYGQAAAQGWQNVGQGLQGLGQYWQIRNYLQGQTPTTAQVQGTTPVNAPLSTDWRSSFRGYEDPGGYGLPLQPQPTPATSFQLGTPQPGFTPYTSGGLGQGLNFGANVATRPQ